jgi:hypothetical protein
MLGREGDKRMKRVHDNNEKCGVTYAMCFSIVAQLFNNNINELIIVIPRYTRIENILSTIKNIGKDYICITKVSATSFVLSSDTKNKKIVFVSAGDNNAMKKRRGKNKFNIVYDDIEYATNS